MKDELPLFLYGLKFSFVLFFRRAILADRKHGLKSDSGPLCPANSVEGQ